MNDKPKVYQNRVDKEFHNNKMMYASYDSKNDTYKQVMDSDNIRKKIMNIISSYDFIYSKMVHIVIGNEVIKKRIIGIENNNLVTIDKEYIPIVNIKDIYV